MWETPFDASMLNGREVIIFCPEEDLAHKLMGILEDNGVVWSGDRELPTLKTRWGEYGGETCYWVEKGRLSFGRKSYADEA